MPGKRGLIKKTWNAYVEEFQKVHGEHYQYPIPSIEERQAQKIRIICPIHSEFIQHIQAHRNGSGCPRCRAIKRGKQRRIPAEDFFNQVTKIHLGKYSYENHSYEHQNSVIDIICPIHGNFKQRAHDHLHGHGCSACYQERTRTRLTKSFNQFLMDAKAVHGDKFEYEAASFVNRQKKMIIICNKHGPFPSLPRDHIHKATGCPICKSKNFISKIESDWLDRLGIPNDDSHRQVWLQCKNRKLCVDGYDRTTNTVYLFHGDYWHGNPQFYNPAKNNGFGRTYGQLYKRTIEYENELIDSGFSLIKIWESEYRSNR